MDVAEVSDEIVTAVAQSEGETASEPATTVVNGITVNGQHPLRVIPKKAIQ